MFGFSGTPIFAKNATNKSNPDFCTTEQAFGDKLHTYTIVEYIIKHFDQKLGKERHSKKEKMFIKVRRKQSKSNKKLLNAPTHTMPMQYNNGATMKLVSYGVFSQAGWKNWQ